MLNNPQRTLRPLYSHRYISWLMSHISLYLPIGFYVSSCASDWSPAVTSSRHSCFKVTEDCPHVGLDYTSRHFTFIPPWVNTTVPCSVFITSLCSQSHPCWVLIWLVFIILNAVNQSVPAHLLFRTIPRSWVARCFCCQLQGRTLGSYGSAPTSKYSLCLEHCEELFSLCSEKCTFGFRGV